MVLWAGVDEAGYGPRLGPLVVAGTAFAVQERVPPPDLWDLLADAVAKNARGSDGRLVVNDSKKVYSPATGLKRLEEGVLAFLAVSEEARRRAGRIRRTGDLFALLEGEGASPGDPSPWFRRAADLALPLESNLSALRSKASVLRRALRSSGIRMLSARAAVVLPLEFNRVVARTRNKSLLLFQKCGLILQELWRRAGPGQSHVLVDKHGGRARYRRLLLDVFPACRCDVLEEGAVRSAYRIADPGRSDRTLIITFQENGEAHALPTALASMTAKYVRELYMRAFNAYWQERMEGLRPTAGYSGDAGRFLSDIAPLLRAEEVPVEALVRRR